MAPGRAARGPGWRAWLRATIGRNVAIPGIVIGAADVRWTGLQPPTVEIVPVDEPGPTDPPAAVRTVTPGSITVTYTAFTSVSRNREAITRQLPVEIGGTVKASPDLLTDKVIWVP